MKRLLFGSLLIFSLFILPISVNADSNGLAGYWKFDEGSGASAYDSSGNGLTGTVSGATWVDGISGKALNFGSVNDYFTMPANSKLTFSNGNFSVDLRFKLPQFFSSGSSSKMKWLLLKNGEYGLVLDTDGKLKFYISSNSGGYMSSVKNSWNANTWYHVVGVFENGNAWKIYINGNLDSSGSATYRTDRTDCSFDVGNFLGCQTAHDNFVGAIDEVKIYSRPLSASEILAEYQSFPTSSSSNSTTTTSPSSSSSWCTNWINTGCEISPCSSDKMKQTQKCGYSNSSGYSSEWENSQCVANETCNSGGSSATNTTDRMLKTIAVTSANCTNAGYGNKVYFTVQNVGTQIVGTENIVSGEVKAYVDGSQNYFIEVFPPLYSTGLPPSAQKQFSLGMPDFAKTRTLKVVGPSNTVQLSLTCSSETVCAQVVTYAKNPATNECKMFGTPCDVPSGWINVISCPEGSGAEGATKNGFSSVDIDSPWSLAGNMLVFKTINKVGKDITINAVYVNGIQTSQNTSISSGAISGWISAYTDSVGIMAGSSYKLDVTIQYYLASDASQKFNSTGNLSGTNSGSSTGSSSTQPAIKEVDKTVLLDVLFGLEQVKIKLDGLKDSALAISEYYSGKGDTAKAGKWSAISSTFDSVINSIDGITAEIKQNKDNITADFIQKIKIKVAGVKADISSVIDKILEVI